MLRWTIVLVVCSALCAVYGCRRQEEEPSQFKRSMKTADNVSFMPVRVPESHLDKKSIVRPAAGADEPLPTEERESAEAVEVSVDDTTAEAVARSYVALVAKGELRRVLEIVDPDQEEGYGEFVDVAEPLWLLMGELRTLLDDRFPGHAIQIPSPIHAAPIEVERVDVDADDEAKATAVLVSGGGADSVTLDLRSVDDRWYVKDPVVEALTSQAGWSDKFESVIQPLEDLLAQIENGEITSEDAVAEKVGQLAIPR